jgi:hypothetical protein
MKKLFYLSSLALLLSLSAFSQTVRPINPLTNRTFSNVDLGAIYYIDSLNGGGSGGCCLDTSFLYKQLELIDSIYLYGKQSANFNQITASATNFSKQIDSLNFANSINFCDTLNLVYDSTFNGFYYTNGNSFFIGNQYRNSDKYLYIYNTGVEALDSNLTPCTFSDFPSDDNVLDINFDIVDTLLFTVKNYSKTLYTQKLSFQENKIPLPSGFNLAPNEVLLFVVGNKYLYTSNSCMLQKISFCTSQF